eukprot:1620496-Amphidinium_carterae.1
MRWWQQVNSTPFPLDLDLGLDIDELHEGGGGNQGLGASTCLLTGALRPPLQGSGPPTASDTTGDRSAICDPHHSLAPHCLFACDLKVAGLRPTMENIMTVREAIA